MGAGGWGFQSNPDVGSLRVIPLTPTPPQHALMRVSCGWYTSCAGTPRQCRTRLRRRQQKRLQQRLRRQRVVEALGRQRVLVARRRSESGVALVCCVRPAICWRVALRLCSSPAPALPFCFFVHGVLSMLACVCLCLLSSLLGRVCCSHSPRPFCSADHLAPCPDNPDTELNCELGSGVQTGQRFSYYATVTVHSPLMQTMNMHTHTVQYIATNGAGGWWQRWLSRGRSSAAEQQCEQVWTQTTGPRRECVS